MDNQSYSISDVMELCLLAGKLMLEGGAETHRVEDTITRLAMNYRVETINVFSTPTAIIVSMREENTPSDYTKLVRIHDRSTNLQLITLVNDLSRRAGRDRLSLQEARNELLKIQKSPAVYSTLVHIIAAVLGSGCFTLMFQGSYADFFPSVLAGGVGYSLFLAFRRFVSVKFFSEVVSSFTIGLIARICVHFGFGVQLDKIIIGSVMPLVPGLLITNAIRDLMSGDLFSGLSRGAEAFLTAFAIGTGIAFVIAAG
ncbi:threonine/serine exporter family protein [Alicyclobacillus dauci]|uniref:Threonine/serine exporter family protein n=2 Tax=Alicyclobacillus dauci TaxID=1475485 RepID=A0ABY6Z896_9BACL|nr:threonine/serine exporter family protein [Alicyclobacillus dauci]